jgi:hypothetical protein
MSYSVFSDEWPDSMEGKLSPFLFKLSILLYAIVLFCPIADAGSSSGIDTMRHIVGGGVTPEYTATEASIKGLRSLNTRRLRLINVDNNEFSFDSSNHITVKWSKHLTEGLQLCKENGWVPHVIIGHVVPGPLSLIAGDGRVFGPSSWDMYNLYIEAFLNFVINEWGFKETEWEVGNEMDISHLNWVSEGNASTLTEDKLFRSYIRLYSHISHVFSMFKKKHSDIKISLGGPAVSPHGFLLTEKNWLLMFITEVSKRKLICDFISLHMYGNVASGSEFSKIIVDTHKAIKESALNATIAITEWGADWHSNEEINLAPIGGSFVFEFVRFLCDANVSDAIFLALSEFPGQKWPVFFLENKNKTYAMNAAQRIAGLQGKMADCTVNLLGVNCIAVATSMEMTVLVWNLDWGKAPISTKWNFFADDIVISIYSGSRWHLMDSTVNGLREHDFVRLVDSPNNMNGTFTIALKLFYGDYAAIKLGVIH